jgi:glycerol-3-phosphate O-acyltransferase
MTRSPNPAVHESGRVLERLENAVSSEEMPRRVHEILVRFYTTHRQVALDYGTTPEDEEELWLEFVGHVIANIASPYAFPLYSRRVREPADLHRFGEAFWGSVVDWDLSSLRGIESLNLINDHCARGENVILVGNHQTEPDPFLLSGLMAASHPEIAEQIIFLAGHRVLTDPVAIPFSMGCNLLCVYSKRHFDDSPERHAKKRLHNARTMTRMRELLRDGGLCIFVAPSGGRDRKSANGGVAVAPFDAGAVEMVALLAKRTETLTHVFPLALSTHGVFPPPDTVERRLGERRIVGGGPVHASFGQSLDVPEIAARDEARDQRCAMASRWERAVSDLYRGLAR